MTASHAAEKAALQAKRTLSGQSRNCFCGIHGAAEAGPFQNKIKTRIVPQTVSCGGQ